MNLDYRKLCGYLENPKVVIEKSEDDFSARIIGICKEFISNISHSRIVFLSGPSASAKTSTSNRLVKCLEAFGISAHVISLDNYFKDGNIIDANNINIESPDCIDIQLLHEHIRALTSHEKVNLPTYNFSTRIKTFSNESTSLQKDEIVIFEGIHALNDIISNELPENTKKIYVRVKSQLYDGENLYLSRNRLRLLRRLIRDLNFRYADFETTFNIWDNVRGSEYEYIVPYRDKADIEIDTFLPYEVSVMKSNVFDIIKNTEFTSVRAKQLADDFLVLLKPFPLIPNSLVPNNSILKEFIK